MMNRLHVFAVLACAALITGITFAAPGVASAAETPNVTPAFAKPLRAANEDVRKGQYRDALAELAKARALPKASPYDTHIINELSWYAYLKTHALADAAKAMEATLDDGFTTKAQVEGRVKNLAILYYQLKDYAKAAQFGKRAIDGGYGDANTNTVVSQAYYLSGDYRASMRFTSNLVNEEIKRGQKPAENQMQIVLNSCVKLKDNECVNSSLRHLVTYYPRPEYWQDIMQSLFDSQQAERSDTDMLNIYRLAADVGALRSPSQYIEMAQLALEQGTPGDAEQVLEQGYGQNVFTSVDVRQHAARLLSSAKKQAATDQSSLPKLASQAAISPKGEQDVAIGMAYLGYKQYDKAVASLSQGIAKGGVKNPVQARLLLGIAQLKSGHPKQAVATFKQVTGNKVLAQLAKLWILRAQSPAGAVQSS